LDWDSTVQTRYGQQQGSEVGYNPHKRGRASHHPLMAVAAGTRLCPYYRWRPGKSATAGQWQGCQLPGVLQTAEIQLQLHGWSRSRRVVVGRRLLGDVGGPEQSEFWRCAKYEYEAYVTTLPADQALSWQVIELYRARADCENVFDELKNQWGFSGFCSRYSNVTETAARLLLVAYNLWNLFLRLLEPSRHVEARHGRRWFLMLSARLTRGGRQRTWKMAVGGEWWANLKAGYERLLHCLSLTAPQLAFSRTNTQNSHAHILLI